MYLSKGEHRLHTRSILCAQHDTTACILDLSCMPAVGHVSAADVHRVPAQRLKDVCSYVLRGLESYGSGLFCLLTGLNNAPVCTALLL